MPQGVPRGRRTPPGERYPLTDAYIHYGRAQRPRRPRASSPDDARGRLGLARVGRNSPGAPTLVRCALSRSTRRPPRRVVVAHSCPTRVRYPGAAGGTSAGGIAPSSSRHQIRLPGFNQPSRSTRCEDVARLHFACSGPAYASVPSTCPRSHPARGSINSPQRAHTTPPASTWRAHRVLNARCLGPYFR